MAKFILLLVSADRIVGRIINGPIITSKIIKQDIDTSYINICGGSNASSSASIQIFGKNHETNSGRVQLIARNENNSKVLTCEPNGSVTWDNADIGQMALKDRQFSSTGYITLKNSFSIQWMNINSELNPTSNNITQNKTKIIPLTLSFVFTTLVSPITASINGGFVPRNISINVNTSIFSIDYYVFGGNQNVNTAVFIVGLI